jgi:hypothetical protein
MVLHCKYIRHVSQTRRRQKRQRKGMRTTVAEERVKQKFDHRNAAITNSNDEQRQAKRRQKQTALHIERLLHITGLTVQSESVHHIVGNRKMPPSHNTPCEARVYASIAYEASVSVTTGLPAPSQSRATPTPFSTWIMAYTSGRLLLIKPHSLDHSPYFITNWKQASS